MTQDHLSQLDNPLWYALTGVQSSFAVGAPHVKRYRPGILPFAAWDHDSTENITALDEWLTEGSIFFFVGELPPLPPHWQLLRELPCAQMILSTSAALPRNTLPITPLTADDRDTMFDLIHKVQPGYYLRDTHQLGRYFGIRQDDKLVAVAGERMQLEGLTEISAVCTDPSYTGRGYAQQLITHICRLNLQRGIMPFLHVLETNQRAISLYEYLGFRRRGGISFWKMKDH